MATPVGPLFAAGMTAITKAGHKITFLPDAHNDELQRAGLPPVFYWMPNSVQLARKENGDYKFGMLHFVGVRSTGTTVGATSTDDEVAGGLMTFSTTSAPPGDILREAQQAVLDQYRGSSDHYWGLRSNLAPTFRFFPIVSNTTSIANISPTADGQIPAAVTSGGAPGGAPAPGAGGAPGGAPAPGGPPGAGPPGGKALSRSAPALIRAAPTYLPMHKTPRTVPNLYRGSNLDPMFVRMSGQGSGSINPDADNAYSAMMGSVAAAIAWNAFHMGTGPIVAYQNMMVRMVSPLMTIDIHGDWSRIQDHFSAHAHAGGWFWSADIKAQYDSLRESGDIEVVTFVDTSLPGADKLQEYMDKRTDLVFQKFMDLAKTTIFDPPPFNEQPAEASGGFLGLGGGVALKLRRQKITLSLDYHERKEMAYLQSYPISGSLDGLSDVITADPSQEKKYFRTLDLGDWDRKVSRIVKPVVNWPDAARKWVGEPVAFLSVQVGYPNAEGAVQWDGHVFGANDGPDAQWTTATAMKEASDVTNPPAGWAPSKTFIKRQIHFSEAPSALDNPFAAVQVETNLVDLDPGETGTLSDLITNEIRVEETGTLAVGPIMLGAMLDAPNQVVEVTFRAKGKRLDGKERTPVKFGWKMLDQDEPRFWMVYTGQPDFVPVFQYQVHVIVKGSLLTKGMEWFGPWTDGAASGPSTISVPTPDDPGVVKKALPEALQGAAATHATPPVGQGTSTPPPAGHSGPTPPPKKSGPPSGSGGNGAKPKVSDIAGWTFYGTPGASASVDGKSAPSGELEFSSFMPR